jgi:LCP family protein required for cell wall assembly
VPPEQRPTRIARSRRRHPVLRRAVVTAVSFTALLGLVSGGLVAYAYAKYNGQIRRITALQTRDRNIQEPQKQAHAENFLIIGSDSRQGANRGFGKVAGERSDTTIVVHLSADHHRATVVSIPRDSWVEIPACTGAKGTRVPARHDLFNSAFTTGGAPCTIATVQKLTGIAITHYVQIDFTGFRQVVDALGRVTICSPQPVDDAKSHLKLRRGDNQLDGAQALDYVRARETLGDGSDLGRIKRQQQFLGVVLRKAMSGSLLRNPVRLTDFLDAATSAITVDRATTFSDLRTLASSLHGLDPKRVAFYTAPIANRDYTPPGTGLAGKVQLDDVKGRRLYQSIIDDASTNPPARSTAPTPAGAAPKPDRNAAERTCSL